MDSKSLKKLERALRGVKGDELLQALLESPRDNQLNLRVTAAQRDQIKEIADAFGLTSSAYLLALHTLALPHLKDAVKRRKT